ncbi:TlpA disulfide reductase family protein [Telmatospirillum sp. J64-1]|uniref:TlpA disulfide reductase family protein n=1 Tax=Telmatospirillum sp. J64-1 TaxID=2502183 RepID=UPI00115EDB88|nr:TlpA disulfide reductase family protein [Telmatospirillum sp. J64-1]
MKRAVVVLAVLAALGGFSAYAVSRLPSPGSVEAATPTVPQGQRETAPAVAFTGPQGEPMTLEDFRGQVLLVNFWATWCAPCVKEMPSLDRLQQRLGGDGFQVLTLSQDRQGLPVVQDFFERQQLTHLPAYLDQDGSAGRALGLQALPTTYLIDAEGAIAMTVLGERDWDSPQMIEKIKAVMEQS